MLTEQICADRDRKDPLAGLRADFDLPEGIVYLDGNSLGPQLRAVRPGIQAVLDQWRSDLIAGWFDRGWADLPVTVGAQLERIIGAEPGTVVACDSTSSNLFKVSEAALRMTSGDILTDYGNFPTDLYVLSEVARRHNRNLRIVAPEDVLATIRDGVGVVAVTQVDFKSGRLHDISVLTDAIHRVGGLMIADLAHSAGVMPIEVANVGVDLAVGCGYKYLNGGPGAPGYLYVSPRHVDQVLNPITGWFGHVDPFLFSTEYQPAAGVARMQVGTPHILSLVGLERALSVYQDIDLQAVRRKSVGLTTAFIELVDETVATQIEVITPRNPSHRGSHVSLRHPAAERLVSALAAQRVVVDHRPPDLARFGFSPLFNTYGEVWEAVKVLARVL
ncbi:MAG: kynureninase [Actinomycetota bacterium]